MYSKEFFNRMTNIGNYFCHDKWSSAETGGFAYRKGKRNLTVLKDTLMIAFGKDLEIIEIRDFINKDRKVIGVTIIGKVFVISDFNGAHQGTGFDYVFLAFTLCETAYFF